jgi:UDPglucose--hexose-1-phosphate uridylyltransferase
MAQPDDPPASGRERLVWNDLWSEFTAQTPARLRRREGATECPFCADLATDRVGPETQAWIRPNDFPALTPPNGECLILIYSRDHNRRFADLATDEALRVVELWRQVYDDLSPRYACVMSWETNGAVIGQTQTHPHGQTYGVSIIPELLQREIDAVMRAEAQGQPCPFCASVAREEAGPRLVFAGEWWVAYVPPWGRYPYHTQIVPRKHFSAMDSLDVAGGAARELAMLAPRLIRTYDVLMREPMPYMLALHQLADERFHFHIEVLPVGRAPGKLKLPASAEMAWGFWLNDAFPEASAAELRSLWGAVAERNGGGAR